MRFLSLTRWLPLCLLTSCTMLGFGPKGLNLAPKDQARMERLLVDREDPKVSRGFFSAPQSEMDYSSIAFRRFVLSEVSRVSGSPRVGAGGTGACVDALVALCGQADIPPTFTLHTIAPLHCPTLGYKEKRETLQK